jgi:hypothetical protein
MRQRQLCSLDPTDDTNQKWLTDLSQKHILQLEHGTDDDLSDTEVDLDNHTEPKEPESSAIRIETAHNKKALKQILKLKSWFNPDPSRFMEVQDSGKDLVVESANFAFNSLNLVEESFC